MTFSSLVIPSKKSSSRTLCLAIFTLAYCSLIFGVYKVQQDDQYTALYISFPLLYLSVWLIVINSMQGK